MNKEIYLAGGCFWGTEHYLKQIDGVVRTETGYANGTTDRPSYRQVYTDLTGHAETVRVEYDPGILPLGKLVRIYFLAIDPLSVNRQGGDSGTRYRTGVYYTDPADLPVLREAFAAEEARAGAPLAVELEPLKCFFPAEEEHQDYLEKHPDGYCHIPLRLMAFAKRAGKMENPELDG